MSWLEELVAGAREDAQRRQQEVPLDSLRERLGSREGGRPFTEALVRPGLSLIAEFKRRAPSAGELRPGAGVAMAAHDAVHRLFFRRLFRSGSHSATSGW